MIGDGFAAAHVRGSENNDALLPGDLPGTVAFASNHAGGILGGISTGAEIVVRIAVKPTPRIAKPRKTINENGEEIELATHGRHDPCVGLRAAPIASAMLALVLADHAMRNHAQCGWK